MRHAYLRRTQAGPVGAVCTEGPAPEINKGCCISGPQREPGATTGSRWPPDDASEPCGPPLRNLVSRPSVGKHSKEDGWFSFQKHLAATWRESQRRQEEAGDGDCFRGQEEGWSGEIQPGRPSQQDKALEGVLQPQCHQPWYSVARDTLTWLWTQRSEKGSHDYPVSRPSTGG